MSWGIVAGAAVGLVGSAMSSDAAGDAADTQAGAAKDATAAQLKMFNKQVELQKPWLDAGGAGLNRLSYLLGLDGTATGGAAGSAPGSLSAAAVDPVVQAYRDLLGRDPEAGGLAYYKNMLSNGQSIEAIRNDIAGSQEARNPHAAYVVSPQEQAQTAATQQAAAAQTPGADFGSLMKTFGTSDFQADPGYAFRQSEQEKALQRAASSSGGIGSGKFLKDAMSYSGGLASQEYGNAYNRFNTNQTNQFNRLAAISGIGQVAANQTGSAASNFGSQIGSNIIGAGNAMAAGQVGSANAINGGLSQGLSMYQNNQMMNRLFPQSGQTSGYGAWTNSPMSSTIYSNGSLGD